MKTVKVANGKVQGQVKSVLDKQIVEFLCIPYCKPPIKELRFQKPQPFDTFSDKVINKTKFETCPPQLSERIFNGTNEDEEEWIPKEKLDEDSLYVNVWCPLEILNGNKLKPTLIWIYGGGFVSGSSSLPIYNGLKLSGQEDIIVVSFNYRIGMLGFLSLDNELIKGNLGIWDQVHALKWIHENISVFNGDPNDISIVGNSAGGCSVSLHLLIKESWQYFNKAISLSGVCYSDWAFHSKEEMTRRSITCVNKLLEKFNIPITWKPTLGLEDKNRIINFLQQLDFNEFLIDSEIVNGIVQYAWTSCVDGELIEDSPRNLYREGKFKKCPTIFLSVENEATYFILLRFPHIMVDENRMTDSKYFKDSFEYFPHFPHACTEDIRENIRKKYKIEENIIPIDVLDRIVSDQHFISDSITLANDVSKMNKEVYYLWFRIVADDSSWPAWCGILHSHEIYYLFGYPESNDESVKFMSFIGNFIKNGCLGKDIPNYDELSKKYLSIENNNYVNRQFTEDQFDKVTFWQNLKEKFKNTKN